MSLHTKRSPLTTSGPSAFAHSSTTALSPALAEPRGHRSRLVCSAGHLHCRDHQKICTLRGAHLPGICSAKSVVGWFYSERLAVQHFGQPEILELDRIRARPHEYQPIDAARDARDGFVSRWNRAARCL